MHIVSLHHIIYYFFYYYRSDELDLTEEYAPSTGQFTEQEMFGIIGNFIDACLQRRAAKSSLSRVYHVVFFLGILIKTSCFREQLSQKYKMRKFIRWLLVTVCCSLLWAGEQLMLQLFPMLLVCFMS